MPLTPVIELLKALGGVVALLGLPVARVTYRRSVKTKRDYDLRLIKQHEFIVAALEPQGFERLAELLGSKHFLKAS